MRGTENELAVSLYYVNCMLLWEEGNITAKLNEEITKTYLFSYRKRMVAGDKHSISEL